MEFSGIGVISRNYIGRQARQALAAPTETSARSA
jgi:hypothetical protein